MRDAKTLREGWRMFLKKVDIDPEYPLEKEEIDFLKLGYQAGAAVLWGMIQEILRTGKTPQEKCDRMNSVFHEMVATLQVDMHKSGGSIFDAEDD